MKYATIDEQGQKYKNLSKLMTNNGYPMSTAYANILVIKILEKIIFRIMKNYEHPIDKKQISELARSSDFQNMLAPIVRKVYEDKSYD